MIPISCRSLEYVCESSVSCAVVGRPMSPSVDFAAVMTMKAVRMILSVCGVWRGLQMMALVQAACISADHRSFTVIFLLI